MNPLAYFVIDDGILIVGSKAGSDTNPHWVHNLRANPGDHIEIGADAYDVIARELRAGDRDAVFEKVVAATPGFGGYQQRADRVIPLFELDRV